MVRSPVISHIEIANDFTGDGRADHVVVNPSTGALTVTLNKGYNSYGQVRFADANKDGAIASNAFHYSDI